MPNYECTCRSNYFQVKDPEAFEAMIQTVSESVGFWKNDPDGSYAVYGLSGGGWPDETNGYDEDGEELETEGINFHDLVSEHLADEEVAIFMQVGNEGMRYVTGFALAINNRGEMRQVDLDDIVPLAKQLGSNITDVSY